MGDNVGGARFGITVGLQAGDGLGVSSTGSARSDFAPYNQQEKAIPYLPMECARGPDSRHMAIDRAWCVKGS